MKISVYYSVYTDFSKVYYIKGGNNVNSDENKKDDKQKISKNIEKTVSGEKKGSVLLKLFLTTLYISAFTFGGGFVIVTFMKSRFVDKLHWITESEMLDLTAIAQASPGAIAVNAAILVGWRASGFFGMITAVTGTVIPPIVIISVISLFYKAFASNKYVSLVLKGMQAGVAAVIFDVVCSLGASVVKEKSAFQIIVMIAAFIASVIFDVNVIFIILAAAVLGVIYWAAEKRRSKSR